MRRRPRTVPAFGGRQLGWTAGVAILVLAVLTAGAAGFWPVSLIDSLVDGMIDDPHGGRLFDLMLVVTALGDGLFLTLVAVVTVTSFLFTGARWRAMCYALCFGSMPVVVHTIKLWVARPRPTDIPYNGVDVFSFPSSHVAHSALIYGAIAGLTFVTFRGWMRWGLTGSFLLLVVMIGASRMYLGAHWLTDVLAGYSLAGLFLVMLAIAVAKHPEPPKFSRAIPITLFAIAAAFPIYLMISLPDSDALYRAIELHQRPGVPAEVLPSP